MKIVAGIPVLNGVEIRTLRTAKTRASYKYSVSGRSRTKPPAPITLRLKDKLQCP